MNWPSLANIIEKLLVKIGEPPVPSHAQTRDEQARQLAAGEAKACASVEAAVRQLARSNETNLSDEERFFLNERLCFAQLLCVTMATPRSGEKQPFVQLPDRDREDVIEWALIDVWEAVGRQWWLGRLQTEHLEL